MVWYVIFFGIALKIPVAWISWVVWKAIRNVPQPGEGYDGALLADRPDDDGDDSWWRRKRMRPSLRRGPHGTPARRPGRPALARNERKEQV